MRANFSPAQGNLRFEKKVEKLRGIGKTTLVIFFISTLLSAEASLYLRVSGRACAGQSLLGDLVSCLLLQPSRTATE